MPDELIIVGPASRPTGGIARYVDEQERILSDNYQVTVHDYSFPRGTGVVTSFPISGIKRSIHQFLKFLFRDEPDVLHVHCATGISFYRSSAYIIYGVINWNCKVVLHIHGSDFDDFLENSSIVEEKYIQSVFGCADEIITLSEKWKNLVSEYCSPNTISILPNAVDVESYDPEIAPSDTNLVFISHLIERKGVIELVESIRSLNKETIEHFSIKIAGNGPLKQKIESLESSSDNVEYLGYVSEERKTKLLNQGSVFVLPSHAEGLPFAILEAMAGGNAIISTTVGSIPEVISDEQGILVSPTSSGELKSAIEDLARSPEDIESMSRTNLEQAKKNYSWDSIKQDLMSIYSKIEEGDSD
jgi:glycosyltransferase involved in cell wall biosynthesis